MRYTILILLSIFTFHTVQAADEGPCKKDIETHCAMVAKGSALVECLSGHEADLTPACKDKFNDMKARNRHTAKACRDDVEKFCSDQKPGGGALIKCLVQNKAKVSKACQETFNRKR
jgi:hypothetical protein